MIKLMILIKYVFFNNLCRITEAKKTEVILGVGNSSNGGRHKWLCLCLLSPCRETWHCNSTYIFSSLLAFNLNVSKYFTSVHKIKCL